MSPEKFPHSLDIDVERRIYKKIKDLSGYRFEETKNFLEFLKWLTEIPRERYPSRKGVKVFLLPPSKITTSQKLELVDLVKSFGFEDCYNWLDNWRDTDTYIAWNRHTSDIIGLPAFDIEGNLLEGHVHLYRRTFRSGQLSKP